MEPRRARRAVARPAARLASGGAGEAHAPRDYFGGAVIGSRLSPPGYW